MPPDSCFAHALEAVRPTVWSSAWIAADRPAAGDLKGSATLSSTDSQGSSA